MSENGSSVSVVIPSLQECQMMVRVVTINKTDMNVKHGLKASTGYSNCVSFRLVQDDTQ